MRRLFPALVLLAGVAEAQSPKRAFTLKDWYRVTTVRQPAMSPDGKWVAFTVTTVREAENKRLSKVWVVSSTSGAPTRVTPEGVESSTPRWAPDGKRLVVTSGGKLIRYNSDDFAAAPEPVDRFQAGSMPYDGKFQVWSAAPDRPRQAPTNDPYSAMGQSRPPYGSITRPADPKRFDGRQIVDFPFRSNDAGYLPVRTGPREFNASQVFIQSFDGSPRRQLTSTKYSHRDVTVSPDGKWVAFVADASLRPDSAVAAENDSIALLPYSEKRLTADRNDNDIYVIPSSACDEPGGCTPRRVAQLVGSENSLSWSPDSKVLAYLSRSARFTQVNLFIVEVETGRTKNLTSGWRYEPDSYFWRPDATILMTASIGGGSAIFSVAPALTRTTQLVGGRLRMTGFTTD